MSLECRILNGACRLLNQKEYRRFLAPCDVEMVQTGYLLRLLRKNAGTAYGSEYGFGDIKSYKEFADKVPLTVYEDYEPYLDAIAEGEKRVLTREDVRLFELTSGSSGGRKRIPYTASLKREFQRGIKPWLADIYAKVPGVQDGKSYWSITPVTAGKSYTSGGIPIGFEEDAQYFGRLEQAAMRRLFAVDGSVKFDADMEDFYRKTSRQLLACRDLALISVWNPTFLTLLCDFMCEHAEELVARPAGETVLAAVRANRFDRVFPALKMISCWADGSAADYIDAVRERFPGVYIQPKGLLATEGFFSFPLVGEEGSRLSVYSHFFEFRRISDGRIVTAGQLEEGEYELILTMGGGFYRYQIGDIIEVLECFADRPPRIRFLRRGGISSDHFGEKLTEEFVRNVCEGLEIAGHFCLLAFEGNRYCLYTSAENVAQEELEKRLCESYHYEYCRKLGQLKMASVSVVTGNPQKRYMERLAGEGVRMGDIKPTYLSTKSGWEEWFACKRRETAHGEEKR